MYTWDDPRLEHELECSIIEVAEARAKIRLNANDFGRMQAGEFASAIYWVSGNGA